MKNYNEMAADVFRRIGIYETEQKRKRKTAIRMAASMSCVGLIALLGFGVWQSGWLNAPPEQTAEDAIYPGIKDTFDESKGESPDDPAANQKIIVNQIDSIPDTKMDICLLVDDFVEMDKSAVKEYFGVNIFPTVPDDIPQWDDERYGIFKRDGGTGEIYWDHQVLNYANEDFSRTVNVEMQKGTLPLCDYYFLDPEQEKSVINNTEVAIGQTNNGYYFVQFLYHNVGFQITTYGLTQDELVAVISSLIQ